MLLSKFSCPLNRDVETFLRENAIEFAKQGICQTHIVFTRSEKEPEMMGYFSLANKYFSIQSSRVSATLRRRIGKFSLYDAETDTYYLSAPLIAQLGRNYAQGLHDAITGDELLKLACDKVAKIQLDLGGRFVYLECEDKPKLIDFYTSNGFREFDRRYLRTDQATQRSSYLVQMLKYVR